jgi:hypothetical protein
MAEIGMLLAFLHHYNTAPTEQEKMLGTFLHDPTILFCVAGLAALLIVAATASEAPAPSRESEPSTTFNWEWQAPVPDDLRQLKLAQGVRNCLPQDLLTTLGRECNAKFGDALSRIRGGV